MMKAYPVQLPHPKDAQANNTKYHLQFHRGLHPRVAEDSSKAHAASAVLTFETECKRQLALMLQNSLCIQMSCTAHFASIAKQDAHQVCEPVGEDTSTLYQVHNYDAQRCCKQHCMGTKDACTDKQAQLTMVAYTVL